MKLIRLGLNTFEDTETKTKFILHGFEGQISEQTALSHIENFKKQRIEVLLATHFNGGQHEILFGQLPK
jgi:hypothetical protein